MFVRLSPKSQTLFSINRFLFVDWTRVVDRQPLIDALRVKLVRARQCAHLIAVVKRRQADAALGVGGGGGGGGGSKHLWLVGRQICHVEHVGCGARAAIVRWRSFPRVHRQLIEAARIGAALGRQLVVESLAQCSVSNASAP